MQIKFKAPGHQKKTVKQVVSSGTPQQFHNFLLRLKLMAELVGI